MTDRTATLNFSDDSSAITFPMLPGTIGPEVIDIRPLYAKTAASPMTPGSVDGGVRFQDHVHRRRQG